MADEPDSASRTILVDEQRVAGLASQFAQSWRRQPTAKELDNLIAEDVREEVYYREARRLGLDDGDPVVRRRLRSKLDYMVQSEVEALTPTDAELEAEIRRNPARYVTDARYSFDQAYVASADRAVDTLVRLNKGDAVSTVTEPLSIPTAYAVIPGQDIDRQFGAGFAASLAALPIGKWTGPVTSGFGVHLVRVSARAPGTIPPLSTVRKIVENDWRARTLEQRQAEAYRSMSGRYSVEIAKPE